MLEHWIMLPAGLLISTVAMFSGLGGGVLWMPFLLSVMGLVPREAVVCTLLIQLCGQASASLTNHGRGLIDWRLAWLLARIGIPAGAAGVLLSTLMHPPLIKFFLGMVTFLIAYVFLRGDDLFEIGGEQPDLAVAVRGWPITAAGGVLTGFLGIGVGDWLVPFFNKRCRLAMVRSVPSAIALMLLLSAASLAMHLLLGARIPWDVALPGILGVVIGAQVGAGLLHKVSEVRFKELFVLMLVFLAAHLTFNAF